MQVAIAFSFIYLLAYAFFLLFNPGPFALFLWACSPLVIGWVVIAVLRDKHAPDKTFDEYFYQDEEWKRNR